MIELRHVVTDADVEAYLDVRNRVEPADPVTRAGFEGARHRPDRLDLLALRDGLPVGMGFVQRNMDNAESEHALAKVGVLREQRRQRIGSQLFRALAEHARSFGRTGLFTEVREDQDAALAYLAKRGYRTVLRVQEIALELGSATVPLESPMRVDMVTLADPALDRPVYDAALEIERDLPSPEPIVTPPFEEWQSRVLRAGLLRDCSFVVIEDGMVVGVGLLYARPWGASHGLTGTRAAWRRRGIARAIKGAQIEAAKRAGLHELRTSNEVANAAIRTLNEALGYRPLAAWLHLRGPLILE